MDQILKWPWKRLHGIYAAMLKRQAVEGIERQKIQMISAIYANANYGSDDISKAVESLEKHFTAAIESVYRPPQTAEVKQDRNEPDWENPFWAGAKRSYDKQNEAMTALGGKGNDLSVKDVVEQEEKRSKRYGNLDQYGKTRGK